MVAETATGYENKMKCAKLKPLHKYRFRVRSVNKNEISHPAEIIGDDILMRDPWGELIIFRYFVIFGHILKHISISVFNNALISTQN